MHCIHGGFIRPFTRITCSTSRTCLGPKKDGNYGCYLNQSEPDVHACRLKAMTHASEAIHGTHIRAPFSPLQKSHRLKKARTKEGLFIGPPTCPLLSNSTWKSASINMHVFVSVSWHTSAALMGSNSKTTNAQCTLSKGSLDLLWRAEMPPHKCVYEYFPIMAFGLLSTLGGCLLFVAAGPFRVGCTTTQKDQARKKLGSSDLATCSRINDSHSPARSAI
jgi:hypothetical protein